MLARNVLIFHAGALGDFVLSWPLGLALGRLHPQSRVIYVTQRHKGDLAERVLRLEAMDVELGWHHLFGDPEDLPEICRRKLQGAHAIYTFVAGSGDRWLDAVGAIAPEARIVPVDVLPPHDFTSHASQRLLDRLAEHAATRAAVGQILASIAAGGIGAHAGRLEWPGDHPSRRRIARKMLANRILSAPSPDAGRPSAGNANSFSARSSWNAGPLISFAA